MALRLTLALSAGVWFVAGLGPAAQPAAEETPAPYDASEAQADVDVVLADRSKAYLQARERLEAHPELAAKAIVARLDAVPAPGPRDVQRLLSVLGALGRSEHVDLFAERLHHALTEGSETEPWRRLLLEQGAAAVPSLSNMVADTELGTDVRMGLLDDLVTVTPRASLGELVREVGSGGDARLRRQLRRALLRRGHADPADRGAILEGLDAALAEVQGERAAPILLLRARMAPEDASFRATLEATVRRDTASFSERVAAIEGLRHTGGGEDALVDVVSTHVANAIAGAQSSEVLTWLALQALPPERAAYLVDQHELHKSGAPRLATAGYALATLPADQAWLPAAQAHAWPSVRAAALERVEAPCAKTTLRALATAGGAISEGADPELSSGRAAVRALGRCGGQEAIDELQSIFEHEGVQEGRRVEAVSWLLRLAPADATDLAVAWLDSGRLSPTLMAGVTRELGHAPTVDADAKEALCKLAELARGEDPRWRAAGAEAHRALSSRFPDQPCG